MSTAIGTTGTGVQTIEESAVAAHFANAADLVGKFNQAATAANRSAERFQGDMVVLASVIQEMHRVEAWRYVIENGQVFKSARAFYKSLFESKDKDGNRRFRALHATVRAELLTVMTDDAGQLIGIGNNELAALIGCDNATLSRSLDKMRAEQKAIESAPVVRTDDELDAIAADATATALESGADEQTAIHAGEQARAEAKQEDAEAVANIPEPTPEEAEAEAKRIADAETKAAKRAVTNLVNAIKVIGDQYQNLTLEQRGEVVKALRGVAHSVDAFEDVQANAGLPAITERVIAAKPKPQQRGPRVKSA